ncbi:hypothetical protein D3C81_1445670 [compost metagenome]
MVVASAGELQAIRCVRLERRRGVLANHHQRFQRLRHALIGEAVIAMTALNMQAQQCQVLEFRQVHTGGRGADFGDRRQFSAGAGVAVHQRTEDFRSRRLGDGGGHLR